MSRKLGISFSFFGDSTNYLKGLKMNYAILHDIYPDSVMIIHTDQPDLVHNILPDVDIVIHPSPENGEGYFWRFLSYNDPRFDAVLFRDADSVINVREQVAVYKWLESGLPIHAMHDHEYHCNGEWPVMAGMWAAYKEGIPFDFNYLLKWWLAKKGPFEYSSDQWFLRRYIWPLIASGDGILHTRHIGCRWGGEQWPTHETYDSFVGARI